MSDYNIQKNGNPSSVEKAVTVFAQRGFIDLDMDEFNKAKNAAFVSKSRLLQRSGNDANVKELNAFMTPRRRSGQSHFFLHPLLELDGFTPPATTIQLWDKLFSEYIVYREQTGRTANEQRRRTLHILADYISIALPTFAMHGSDPIKIPGSPKEFTRYPFIDQSLRPKPFPTFLDYLVKRGLAKSTQKSLLYSIQGFFRWVELNLTHEDFSDVVGSEFKCPLHNSDFPFVPRPNSTTKIPFAVDVYPLLFLYVHEVEQIGMYLEAHPDIAKEVCNLTNKSAEYIINLRKLNVDFKVIYQHDVFVISQIPQRLIFGKDRASGGINLSVLRLLTLVIETGLRCQSAQWLDINSWGKHLDNFSDEDPIKKIHINTDKTGETKDIRVLSRVAKLLKRQQDHRNSKHIPELVFDYEGRTSSPFEPLVPLFANENGTVISDNNYLEVWSDLLLGLQGFLHENGVSFKPLTKVKSPNVIDEGLSDLNGFPICQLNWSPVHTPHSARSSFVTRRAGSTEYAILAELIGHNDPIVTAYYDVPDFVEIIDVLEHKHRPSLTASSGVSELQARLTSVGGNSEDVIRQFGISSLRELHESETSDGDPKGIELLKSSQVSELVFRDTHICPAGEVCPDDVILAAGGPMRCGTCKLACKSIDHLPAIEGKCRQLTARIQATSASLMREKQGQREQGRLKRLQGALMTDSYQLVGWQDAGVTLRRLWEEKQSDGIVSGSPDIIKKHLKRVVRQVRPAQFLVDRIIDAKMYPSLSDEILQRQASRLARKLAMSDQDILADENEEVLALYSLIKTRLKALGMTWDEAGALIEREVGTLITSPHSTVRLLNASA